MEAVDPDQDSVIFFPEDITGPNDVIIDTLTPDQPEQVAAMIRRWAKKQQDPDTLDHQ